MEATSSLTWSRHPEPNLIGVSVFQNQNHFSLRFHIRTTHLEQIKNPKTLGIRGSAQNGFILTPDSEAGVKPSRVAKSDLFYVMQTLTKFNLSKRERRTVWMHPEFENGHLRIPPYRLLGSPWKASSCQGREQMKKAGGRMMMRCG
jgi:hypothetical protein